MPRTKRTEKAMPKMGEVISFASLKAARDAKRADVFCSVGVLTAEIRKGDVVLCKLYDGGDCFAICYDVSDEEDGTQATT